MRDARKHNKIAGIVGFDYNSSKNNQKFTSTELDRITDYLGVEIGSSVRQGKKKEAIAERCGFQFNQGYSSTPRSFNREELDEIIETLQKREGKVVLHG